MPRYADEMIGAEGETCIFQLSPDSPERKGTVYAVTPDGSHASIKVGDSVGGIVYHIPYFCITLDGNESTNH